jgi:predicted HicB family RNase H-like nuclease
MHKFENYTLVISETPEEHYSSFPSQRFLAYLDEIPKASFHEYGSTQEESAGNLRKLFESFVLDSEKKKIKLPEPKKDEDEQYSGKIVLRMPPWLHAKVSRLAAEQEISINSYVVHQLIYGSTVQEMNELYQENQKHLLSELQIHFTRNEIRFAKPTDFRKTPPNVYSFVTMRKAGQNV